MKEITKTVTFVAVAAVVALLAFASRPSLPVDEPENMVGKELFPDFTDPLAAASLEIFEFDEDTGSVRPFKVAQVNQRWSIPSHDNYPADAEDQLADVAAGLMALRVLDTASDSPGDHELYGVVEPDPQKLSAGATGVGTRVTMKDENDKTLLSLVIGKEVPDQDGLHYVRRAGQDPVYTVAVETGKISTSFQDWIEEDLLKLSSWDIEKVEVRDYSIDELRGTLNMRNRLTFDYNDTGDPKWKLAEDLVFGGNDWVQNTKPMTDAEELDTEKLNDMRRALDDLEIVDVAKKPEGLSADLSNLKGAGEFLNNREAVASLQSRGFYAVPWQERVELFSNEGEIRCLTNLGVRYILRFGNIAGSDTGGDTKQKKEEVGGAAETGDDGDDSGGVNRFLFVMAEFDPSVLEKPELEPLPEPPKEEDAEKPEKKAEADDKKTEADGSDGEKEDEEKSEAQKQYEEELARVEEENQRKQDEYKEKAEEGKEKVDELNRRFADWYYVISDSTYQKIHLSRDDVIKEAEKEEKKPAETKPTAKKPAEAAKKPAEKPATESPKKPEPKPAETKPAEKKPVESDKPSSPAEKKSAEKKPAEKKPAENKPTEAPPAAKEPKGEAPPAKN